jgi:branched-chain amino acid transport system substrate-binding protein
MTPVRLLAAAALAAVFALPAVAQGTIKIGEVNSYKAQPAFLEPYKKGMELAVDEVNAAGGVAGRKLELITRDDNANPGDAVRVAEELLSREKVDVLTGTFLSHIGLAVTDFAKQKKVFFLAGEPLTDKIVWAKRQRLHLPPAPQHLHAGRHAGARGRPAKLKKKRWAVVYPNYEYGQSAVATFKELLKAGPARRRVRGRAGAAAGQARGRQRGAGPGRRQARRHLQRAVRRRPGQVRARRQYTGLFKGREVVSLLTGEPEYLDPLKDETPNGWIVTGYPWNGINTPEHRTFLAAYQKQVQRLPAPGLGGGLCADQVGGRGVARAGGTETEAGRRLPRAAGRHAVRPHHVPAGRPPVDHGRPSSAARRTRAARA